MGLRASVRCSSVPHPGSCQIVNANAAPMTNPNESAVSIFLTKLAIRCPSLGDVHDLQQQISLCTKGHGDMHDLTEQTAAIVNSSGIQTGLMHVFNVGSTAALGTIEFEPDLQRDLLAIWTSSSLRAVIMANEVDLRTLQL